MDVAYIVAASITGTASVAAAAIGLRNHANWKTGNGLTPGQTLYKLLEHIEKPINEAHPAPLDD